MDASSTRRLAAYGLCVQDRAVLLVQVKHHDGSRSWTLPGGGVEPLEDPFDTVIREFTEETGYTATVHRLLGVDSRVIPPGESWRRVAHQNIGIFYHVNIMSGALRQEANGDTMDPTWVALDRVAELDRSSLVDVGLQLFRNRPVTGHVASVPIGGPIRH
ncbi:NUDIX hydrolase [Enteractinococcus coprophilus]|uniref:ADP-ribose pyrophosphatase YjhB (NUDIX family) n=1 Tax=Enteractinococcus coprophilus TaxID=1027633 RepID=A0A543AII7_9MICC|nr:NUDIX domain-containing protein [Enteractinococcus coprophilus]TQL72397.1 ADP-ribose pyrophosphatase YjhB (NUDIX family) [Enteractinococcus coprophilus]